MPRGATLAAFNRAYSHELCDCDPHDVNAPRCRSTLPIGNPAIPGRVCYRSKYRSRRSRSSAALNDHTAWTQSPGYGRGRSSRMRFCAGPAERIPGGLRRARPPTGAPSTAFRLSRHAAAARGAWAGGARQPKSHKPAGALGRAVGAPVRSG
jgi:hypothetical protein